MRVLAGPSSPGRNDQLFDTETLLLGRSDDVAFLRAGCVERDLVDTEATLNWEVSGTTLRARRDEWIRAGAFDDLAAEALAAHDRIIEVDLGEVAVDGSRRAALRGGEGTGPNCADRCRSGWKWSLATDTAGIPIGIVAAPANRNDCNLVAATLDDIDRNGLLGEIDRLHLDRSYGFDVVRQDCAERGLVDVRILTCRQRRSKGRAKEKPVPLGLRWPVERTNSWLANFVHLPEGRSDTVAALFRTLFVGIFRPTPR